MENHFILCGVGQTGLRIVEEFGKTGKPLVVIDHNREHLAEVEHESSTNVVLLQGDATDEDVLSQAGLEKAAGLICNLGTDPENLFLTITARTLNTGLRIVTSATDVKSRDKLLRAGADSVVFPSQIGAMRLASEMIRPTVVTFLDRMLRDPRRQIRVSEVPISKESEFAGQRIRRARIHEDYGLLVVAIHSPEQASDEFHYNPPADMVIEPGSVLVVIGEVEQVERLSRAAAN
jgi:voltage-gated potassium channel